MLIQIVRHTPPWVWGLLAALVALGLSQTLPRQMSTRRVTVLPIVLLALSLAGVATTFSHQALPVLATGQVDAGPLPLADATARPSAD